MAHSEPMTFDEKFTILEGLAKRLVVQYLQYYGSDKIWTRKELIDNFEAWLG